MKKHIVRFLLLCVMLLLSVCVEPITSNIAAPLLDDPHVFLQSWGSEIGVFHSPTGIAVGEERVYVCDTGGDRIQIFDLHGMPLATFGGSGSGDGQLDSPSSIVADASGNIYVADTGATWESGSHYRIQKFTSDGTFLTKWGDYGNGDGQFYRPSGVMVDEDRNIYVVDTGNHRIQKFASDGTFLIKWGGYGLGDGQFDEPSGIAVDVAGNVYVADTNNNRIQKFTSDGMFLAKWGSAGSGDGQFQSPHSIAVDESGNVYVTDSDNSRIQKFTSNGTFLAQWGSYGNGEGQFNKPSGIAVTKGDTVHIYVVDTDNDRIQKLTSDGDFLVEWGKSGDEEVRFRRPHSIAVDEATGDIFVTEESNHRIQKFTSDGTFLTQWGSEGSEEGQFSWIAGIAVDASGNVYAADLGNDRIQKFTSDGIFLTQWGSEGSGEGQFYGPDGIAVDGSGNVYVADSWNWRIQKFTSDGTFLTEWESGGMGTVRLDWSRDLTVDGNGNVYLADSHNHRIQKFTSDGTLLTQWGGQGHGDGLFRNPHGVTVDGNENVYVADTFNHRIQKFTSDGIFLLQWGSRGSGDNQFDSPWSITVDGSGNLYIADSGNHRIQKFAPDYPTPDLVHGLALNGSFEDTLSLVRWTYGGELPVGEINDAVHGTYSAQLGEPTPQTEHEQGMAWMYQTMYIRPEWQRPVLTFYYRMFVNDIIHYSDFHVWLSTSNGVSLTEVKRDGYDSPDNTPPPPGYDMGWRTVSYDLSAFKGQTVRVVFEDRNLHSGYSWGIWTYVDDVRVVDAEPWLEPSYPSWTTYTGVTITQNIALTTFFTQPVTMALTGLPTGVEGTFSPNPAPPNSAVDVALVASSSTVTGTYDLLIIGSTGVLTRTASVNLSVLPSNITPTISPGARIILRGQSTDYTVGVTATPGFTSPIALEVGPFSQGTLCLTLCPSLTSTISPGDSTTLFITTTTSTPTGTYQITITGTAASLVRTTQARLVVADEIWNVYLPLVMRH